MTDRDTPAAEIRASRKQQVALGYRIFAAQRWGDLGDGHISARDPERTDCFWVLRYGVSYHAADPILHWMIRGYDHEALRRAGFDPGAIEIVRRRLDSTHWKRELPTVAVLSSSAIGEFYLRPVDY